MNNPTIARPCFICGSGEGDEVFSADLDVCGLGAVHYALRCCAGCSLVLQDPAVSPKTMLRQYSMFSNYTSFTSGPPPLPTLARRILAMAEDLPPGRLYDVGAATGAMAWHFREKGWQVGGCDPSALAVAQARDLNGIDLDIGVDEDALPAQRDLDLVTFCHVLEHIYDPSATLARVHDALAPGGHVLFEVPCLIEPARNPPGLFMMEHLNYFDQVSIANMLARVGFAIVRTTITPDQYLYPVITVLAQKAAPAPDAPIESRLAANLAFCRAYTGLDRRAWAACDLRLRKALAEKEAIYVWGAGLHTSSLLARTSLASHARILAVTDRDPQKHGHTMGQEIPVIPPEQAMESGQRIVVSSYASERAIIADLLRQGVSEDRLVSLYS